VQSDYQIIKASLLKAGTQEHITTQEMVVQLELMSQTHRLAEQIEKGARYLASFRSLSPAEHIEENEAETPK
jgi:hypothetical protein